MPLKGAAVAGVQTFVAEKSVQLLFGNDHPQFVTTVDDKDDGMALSENRWDRGIRKLHSHCRTSEY